MNEKMIAPFLIIVLFLLIGFSCKSDKINSATESKKSLTVDSVLQQKEVRLIDLTSSFYRLEVDSFWQIYSQIKSDSTLIKTVEDEEQFKKASRAYFSYFQNNTSKLHGVETAITNNVLPTELEPYALLELSRYYLELYNTTMFKFFSSKFFSKYPNFNGDWYQEVIECSSRIITKIDSLAKLDIPKDEWLYKETQLKTNLVHCGVFGDTYYDYSIVYDNYKELLSKFPNSQYADNAAFYFIQNYFDGDGDWIYSAELVNKIQNFILKYPNSELKVNAQRQLASQYRFYEGNQSQKIKFKEKGLAELEKIDLQKVGDSLLISNIEHEKRTLQIEITKEFFDIEVFPMKNYKLEDKDMMFKIIVTNKTPETRPLNLFSDNTPFGINFYSKNKYQFEEDSMDGDTIAMTKLIPPNDSIVHFVNLHSNVRNMKYNNGQNKGSFSFNTPGFYYISVSSADKLLRSKQMEFYIHEN